MLLVVNEETKNKLKDFFEELGEKDKLIHTLNWKKGTKISQFIELNNNNNEPLKCVTDKMASLTLYGENMLFESATTNALLYTNFTEFKESLFME